jgi:replicative DNA helicase
MAGELIVVGASPGIGKTSFALHLALTALSKGYRVGFISVEMSFKAILGRVIAHETGINSRDIRDGYLGKEQLEHIGKTTDRITKSPIKIINNLYNIDAISATIRDMTSRLGIQFWAVDYLQLIKGHGKDRRIEVGDIAREMMVLAKTMEVPVVLLSQLARTDNARPKMKDLKESGDIEAHAHKIILLSNDYEDTDNITVDLVKNRDGEVAAFTKRVVKSTGHWFDPNEPEQMTRPETTEDIPF